MAQNIILSFLGGSRIIELKTIQILDRLQIPRPCIDVRNIGFNVEWSQELRLEDSYTEYVTAWILLKIIEELELLGVPKGSPFFDTVFDISVGYDLEGIESAQVHDWLSGIRDATPVVKQMLSELPRRYANLRDLEIDPKISDSATLSTFHGCPRAEIEAIMQHLISEHHLHAIVKMNPTILGYDFVERTLREELGYDVELDRQAFENDLHFDEAVEMMRRLQHFAGKYGRLVGAKFTNTLVVKNNEAIFKDDVMYLSGPPLHVLSMNAMHRFRTAVGEKLHISFSAGIDKHNFAEAVSCNMKPVSVCSDLLKTGGYMRLFDYMKNLKTEMQSVQARCIDEFIRSRAKCDPEENIATAGVHNANRIVPKLVANPRYHRSQNVKEPPKIDSHLEFFDCITCNKCLPVCPNAANFSIRTGQIDREVFDYKLEGTSLVAIPGDPFILHKSEQIANLADFCNECGDCDTYCPELGGPFIEKPRFFFSKDSYDIFKKYDGLCFLSPFDLVGRIDGVEYSLSREPDNGAWTFTAPGFELSLDSDDKLLSGKAVGSSVSADRISMRPYHILKTLYQGIAIRPDAYPAKLLMP
jgi:putative selenate reductase